MHEVIAISKSFSTSPKLSSDLKLKSLLSEDVLT